MKISLPSIFEYNTAVSYFAQLVALNQNRRGFSQRSLALRLGWPAGYLPDLLKGRKPFTVVRAYEFTRKFNLDSMAAERLILMAVASQNPNVAEALSPILLKGNNARKPPTQDPDLLDFQMILVYEAIRWLRGKASPRRIQSLLERQKLSMRQIQTAIRKLTIKKLIAKEKSGYVSLVGELDSTDDLNVSFDDALHKEMAKNLCGYFDAKIGPAIYNAGILHLQVDRFNEVVDRVTRLRNWLLEISSTDSKLETHNSRLFQMDLNITPLFNRVQLERNGFGGFSAVPLLSK